MTKDDIEFIQNNHTSGETEDGIPWIAVPNRPGEAPYTLNEICEALRLKRKSNETGSKKDV